jgi:hypothetical protein
MTRRWYRSFDPGLVGHTFSDRSLSMRFSSPGRVRQRTAGGRGGWERVRKGGGGGDHTCAVRAVQRSFLWINNPNVRTGRQFDEE